MVKVLYCLSIRDLFISFRIRPAAIIVISRIQIFLHVKSVDQSQYLMMGSQTLGFHHTIADI